MSRLSEGRVLTGALCLAAAATVLPLGGCLIVVHDTEKIEHDSLSYNEHGSRPMIGVTTEPVGPALATQLGVQPGRASVVTSVGSGTPAERAGVQRYDVITQIDGSDLVTPNTLREAVRTKKDGDQVHLHVIRAGQAMDLAVAVNRPSRSTGTEE